jgi:hypothetical protein
MKKKQYGGFFIQKNIIYLQLEFEKIKSSEKNIQRNIIKKCQQTN